MKNKKIISIFISFMLAIVVAFSSITTISNAATSTPQTAKSGNYVYFANGNKIRRVNLETKACKTIKELSSGSVVDNISVKDGWIYFSRARVNSNYEVESSVCRVKTTGSSFKTLATNATMPVVYGSKIYYLKCKAEPYSLDITSVGFYKMNLTGSSKASIKKASRVSEFTVYENRIYYTYTNSSATKMYLYSMKLDSSNLKKHVSNDGEYIYNLTPYSGSIYYNNSYEIYCLNATTFKNSKHKSSASLLDKDKNGTYYENSNGIYRRINGTSKTVIKKADIDGEILQAYAYGDYLLVDILYTESDVKTVLYTKNGKSIKTVGKYSLYRLH